MKRTFFALMFVFSITFCNAQMRDSVFVILENCQKDYLYHLYNLNKKSVLNFKTPSLNNSEKMALISNILKVDIQFNETINMPFFVQEKCDSASIQANIFFIMLKPNCDNYLIEEAGSGEVNPNKVILTYKWNIQNDVLIFIFTNRELNHPFQKYIY